MGSVLSRGACVAILSAVLLRAWFMVGVSGARDDREEMKSALNGVRYYPSTTWGPQNRLAVIIPKRIVYRVLGPTPLASSCVTFAADIGLVILAYLVGKALWSESAGLWSAALMAVSPFDLVHCGTPWAVDILLSFYMALAFFCALHGQLEAAAFCAWLAFRTKGLGLFVVVVLLVLLGGNRARLLRFAAAAAVLFGVDMLYCKLSVGSFIPESDAARHMFGFSIRAYDFGQDLPDTLRMVFWGGQLGWHPALAASAVVLGLLLLPRRASLYALMTWIGLYLTVLVFKPSGLSLSPPTLYYYHWDHPRYYCILFLPAALVWGGLAHHFERWRWVCAALFLLLALSSLRMAAAQSQIVRNHQRWLDWTADQIQSLPANSTIVCDQSIRIWLTFRRPQLLESYRVLEITANAPDARAKMADALSGPGRIYVVVGGPRGLETPDKWRMDESFLPPQRRLLISRSPGAETYDGYFNRRDATQIWQVSP